MDLAAIQASIQAKGYDASTASMQTIAINSCYRDTCGSQRWPFLEAQTTFAVTQGVFSYPLSDIANMTHLDAVRLEDDVAQNNYDLSNKEPQAFRDIQQLDIQGLYQAVPRWWTNINQAIQFYPVPDQTYTARVDYILAPTDLVNPTDVPVMPAVYHDLLVWGAIAEIAYRERDWLGRQFAQGEQQGRLQHMKDEYLLRQRQTSSKVKRSGYWDSVYNGPFAEDMY